MSSNPRNRSNARLARACLYAALAVSSPGCASSAGGTDTRRSSTVRSGTARSAGLDVYYEVHGSGSAQPLVMLHGALMTNSTWGELLALLAQSRRVIAIEQQAHGHTPDIDRPLGYEQMADDTAAVLRHLGIERAHVLGYSMGGGVALQLAMRHAELVDRLVLMSAPFRTDGWYPDVIDAATHIDAKQLVDTPWHQAYVRAAPRPGDWERLVERIKELDSKPYAWPDATVRAIRAPTLVMLGDADGVRPEHAVELFRNRGGGVFGDIRGLPAARLAVVPGTTHVGILDRTDVLPGFINAFLDAPDPKR